MFSVARIGETQEDIFTFSSCHKSAELSHSEIHFPFVAGGGRLQKPGPAVPSHGLLCEIALWSYCRMREIKLFN